MWQECHWPPRKRESPERTCIQVKKNLSSSITGKETNFQVFLTVTYWIQQQICKAIVTSKLICPRYMTKKSGIESGFQILFCWYILQLNTRKRIGLKFLTMITQKRYNKIYNFVHPN